MIRPARCFWLSAIWLRTPHVPSEQRRGADGDEGERESVPHVPEERDWFLRLLLNPSVRDDVRGCADWSNVPTDRRTNEECRVERKRRDAERCRNTLRDRQHREDVRNVINERGERDG